MSVLKIYELKPQPDERIVRTGKIITAADQKVTTAEGSNRANGMPQISSPAMECDRNGD